MQKRLICIIPESEQETARNDPVLSGGGWNATRLSEYDSGKVFYICSWRSDNHEAIYTRVRELNKGKSYYLLPDSMPGKSTCTSSDGDEDRSACKLYSPNLVKPEE